MSISPPSEFKLHSSLTFSHIPVFAQLRIKGKVDPNHPSDDKPNGYRR